MNPIRINTKIHRTKYFIPLTIAAIWNIFFGSLGFFNIQLSNSLFLNAAMPQSEIIVYKIMWLVVIMVGIGYGIVSFLIHRFRFFITFGAIAKTAVFMFVSYSWLNATVTNLGAIVAIGDLFWVIYFIYFLLETKEHGFF